MKVSERLLASTFIMLVSLVVPYTGTALAGLLFTAVIYFPDIVEVIVKANQY